jgi:hypothetical protein
MALKELKECPNEQVQLTYGPPKTADRLLTGKHKKVIWRCIHTWVLRIILVLKSPNTNKLVISDLKLFTMKILC